ncbi:MAG TPA: hypothetical protein VK624_10815 [Steroidobacteraceae bacterium]|nr:hypothetical protein [Steroidobacteraceae bacterium]
MLPVRPDHGSVFPQSVEPGLVQIVVSFAARLAAWFARNPPLDPRRN